MKKTLLFVAILLLSVFLISCDETSTEGNLPIETPEKSEITEEVPATSDTRFISELNAHYSADEKNGYSVWSFDKGNIYINDTDPYEEPYYYDEPYCVVDYNGYITFTFDENEENKTNIYNSAVITEKDGIFRLRSAVDGRILYTTEGSADTKILFPNYYECNLFKDGYIFVCSKSETYTGVTYKIGFLNPQGEWIVPISENNPILTTLKDKVTESYLRSHLTYCGEGMIQFEMNDIPYLYNIDKNTLSTIKLPSHIGWYEPYIPAFNNGYCVVTHLNGEELYGYYKIYNDGKFEDVPLNFHEDLDNSVGTKYYDPESNRVIVIGYTNDTDEYSVFDSTGKIIKRLENLNVRKISGFDKDGLARITLSNKEGSTYYTVMDINGNFLFEPIKFETSYIYNIDDSLSTSGYAKDYTIIDNNGKIVYQTPFVDEFGINNGVITYTDCDKEVSEFVDLTK